MIKKSVGTWLLKITRCNVSVYSLFVNRFVGTHAPPGSGQICQTSKRLFMKAAATPPELIYSQKVRICHQRLQQLLPARTWSTQRILSRSEGGATLAVCTLVAANALVLLSSCPCRVLPAWSAIAATTCSFFCTGQLFAHSLHFAPCLLCSPSASCLSLCRSRGRGVACTFVRADVTAL